MTPQPPSTEELLASVNRALPFSDEAEKGLISCWLQDPTRLDDGAVVPAAFYHEANQTVAVLVMERYAAGKPLSDPALLTHELRTRGLLERVGGPAAISELFTFTPIPSHNAFYRKIVSDCYRQRQLIGVLAAGIHRAFDYGKDGAEATFEALAEGITSDIGSTEADDESADLPCTPIKTLAHRVVAKLEDRMEHPGRLVGISTGFAGLDEDINGIQTGGFYTILGASSMGKSMLARQMVETWALTGNPAVILTWEMQDEQEVARVLCSQGRLSNSNLKRGLMSRAEQQALLHAVRRVGEMPLSIIDCGGKTIERVIREIKRRVRKLPDGKRLLVVIDYLQLVGTQKQFPKQRQQQIAYITQSLKQCAKTSRIGSGEPRAAIIGLSQVNKDGEAREAEDIINDSDVALKILPDRENNKETPAYKRDAKAEEWNDRDCLIQIVKNRDGPKFRKIKVVKLGEYFRFEEPAEIEA